MFGALQSFRRELESPGDHERDRESDRDQQYHQPHNPIWNLQERKNLRRDLDQKPADNRISHSNLVNVAPLQLGEEILRVHRIIWLSRIPNERRVLPPAIASAQGRPLLALHLPSLAAYGAVAPVRESVRRRRSYHSEVLHPKHLDDS